MVFIGTGKKKKRKRKNKLEGKFSSRGEIQPSLKGKIV